MKDKRLKTIAFCFYFLFFAIICVQAGICIFKRDEYSKNVVMQRTGSVVVKDRRGKFYDRNMIPLVENTASLIKICENEKLLLPVRYSQSSPACHLIGYIDGEGTGVSGLEKCFDKFLKASASDRVNVVKGADGRIIETAGMSYNGAGNEGDSVVLTLDAHIQNISQNALLSHGITGAVVVMDVDTFDVLAMASTPVYKRDNVTRYLEGDGSELVNRCVSPYNAGSIFKIVTLASALENNRMAYMYFCNGKTDISNHTFNCHKAEGHGALTPVDAFAESCNCAFYKMGLDLGASKIMQTAQKFGIGNTVVCCNGFDESSGFLPLKEKYAPLDAVNYAIGQGEVLITPLQAAKMAAIIAGGGVVKKTNIAQNVVDCHGRNIIDLREDGVSAVVSPQTAEFIGRCMRLAVTQGTALGLKDSPANIAGKTGTAETGWTQDGKNMVQGWFCGFFPYENPRYAMAVLSENGGSGSKSAAPVFKDIAEEIIKFYPMG